MGGRIVVLSGYSGAGKNTIINKLDKDAENVVYIPSVTTREVRVGESQGNPYYFVSEKEFLEKVGEGRFIEYEQIHGDKFYGSLKDKYDEAVGKGKTIVKDIDVNGAVNFKKMFGDEVSLVFVQPSNEDDLRERLINRGDDERDILVRLKRIEYEKSFKKEFDFILINDDIEKAVSNMIRIIRGLSENGKN